MYSWEEYLLPPAKLDTSCDTVIYKKYLYMVFMLISGPECLKNPWNFLSDESDRVVFFYINEVTFEEHLRTGLVASGANHVIRGLELPPTPTSGEGREAHRLTQSLMVNELINPAYLMKLP